MTVIGITTLNKNITARVSKTFQLSPFAFYLTAIVSHFSYPSTSREKFNLFREIRAIIITSTWTEN
jgi:hypothetical protein